MAVKLGVSYPVAGLFPGINPSMNAGLAYKVNADGTIGVDYFIGGRPATNQEFSQITGIPEEQVLAAYQNSQPQQQTAQPTGGGGTGETNPYTSQQLESALKAHQMSVKNINDAYNSGLLDFSQKEKSIAQNREDLKTQMNTQSGQTAAAFSAMSPDAFQSQLGNYNQNILNDFNRNNNNLTDQSTVLSNAKANYPGQQQGALANEIANYNTYYGKYNGYDQSSALRADPNFQGTATSVAPALTPVTMAQVGAQFSPYSPNGAVGQKTATPDAKNLLDQYLNGQ